MSDSPKLLQKNLVSCFSHRRLILLSRYVPAMLLAAAINLAIADEPEGTIHSVAFRRASVYVTTTQGVHWAPTNGGAWTRRPVPESLPLPGVLVADPETAGEMYYFA